MRYTLIETFWIAIGLSVTALITAAAAWAYPIGANVIRRVGIVAAIAVVAIAIAPLRDAWARDRRDGDA